jgi:hypothetical protein
MKMFWGAQINHRGGKHLYMPIVARNGSMVYLSLCGISKQNIEPVHGFQAHACAKCEEQARAIGVHPGQLQAERDRLQQEREQLLVRYRQVDALLIATGFEMAQGQ